MADDKILYLVYDRQCPMCERYCRMVRLRESVGELRLVDAREGGSIVEEITRAGLDIDQGMVVKIGGKLYYGSDAIHVLSLMSGKFGCFNRFNYLLFKSSGRARLLYPVLRNCRNLVLRLLGIAKINNLNQPGNDRF